MSRTSPPCTARRTARRGFTLLEILVVIGIILLLVSIGVIGFRALDQSPKVTKTTLDNLQSMLAEFQAMTDLREQPPKIYVRDSATTTNPQANPPIDLWFNPVELPASGGSVAGGSAQRYDWGPVANTQIVLRYLNRVPANKQIMTQLPSKQVHGLADGVKGNKLTPSGGSQVIDPPLVLDAWNNPILFVGKAGLDGVTFEDRPGEIHRVTTAGVARSDEANLSNPPKSWRPFFASAGQDGDFKTGDDNLYSFEQ